MSGLAVCTGFACIKAAIGLVTGPRTGAQYGYCVAVMYSNAGWLKIRVRYSKLSEYGGPSPHP